MLTPLDEHELLVFWTQLLVLVATARLCGSLMRRINLPSVIGQLAAGVILGPSIFGRVWERGFHWFLPEEEISSGALFAVSWLGVALLLVTAGFEPVDILQGVLMLLRQLAEGRCEVENQYRRVVDEAGNPQALRLLREAFVVRPHFEWRGLGFIGQSALALAPDFADWDAELRFDVPGHRVADPKACQCGEVLKGALRPWECKVFGTACTPETPIGTCMVSSEGACAAYYNYGRYSPRARIPVSAD